MAAAAVENKASLEGKATADVLKVHVGLLAHDERHIVSRVLYNLPSQRPRLSADVLSEVIAACLPSSPLASIFQSSSTSSQMGGSEGVAASTAAELYVWLLVVMFLVDQRQLQLAHDTCQRAVERASAGDAQVADVFLAKFYFYLLRIAELGHHSSDTFHKQLMVALRMASLKHRRETHAMVYVLLLRNCVLAKRPDLAGKLLEKSPFPEHAASALVARYHYYHAHVCAVQTRYKDAQLHLEQALRKAPHGKKAAGFVQAASKLAVVVELLLGSVPERTLFRQAVLHRALQPYFELSRAVYLGDAAAFARVSAQHQDRFVVDHTYPLVLRLHENVLKAGLRRLNTSYTRISLADVYTKLGLSSVHDARFFVMKAIRDGVVLASLDESGLYMQSETVANVYYTHEPQQMLNARIQSCMALHNESLRAMQYPDGVLRKKKETTEPDHVPTEVELMEEYMDAEDDFI